MAATSAFAGPPSFLARTELDLGNVVTTGDYNKDGLPDLIAVVSTSTGDYQISVQLNNGNGTFSQGPTVDLGTGFTPVAVAAADFNGDGKLDIAVLSTPNPGYTATLYVAIQHNNGFLITPIQLPEQISNTANIAIGDLNGDKLPDIVIPTLAGTTFLLNAGNGRFKTPEFASTSGSNYVILADLNGDHQQDLVVQLGGCCGNSGPINVLLGDGHGGFYEPSSQPPLNSSKIAVADLNGDDKLDLFVANGSSYPSPLAIALGKGDGTFAAPVNLFLPAPFSYATAVAAGDLNGDGAADLEVIGVNGYDEALIVFPNAGKGSFNGSTVYSVETGVANIILADFTSIKATDVLLTPSNPAFDALLLNNGKGVFRDGASFATATPQYLVSGDFNNDGRNDLIGVNSSGLTVYLNSGNTTIFNPLTPLPFYTGPLVTGDFNGDGRIDLVAANNSSGSVLLGAGGGSFVLKPQSLNLGPNMTSLAAADMNGDGKLDLVTNAATVILGNGDGTFQPPNSDLNYYCYNTYNPGATITADFNRDGKPDVLALCGGQASVFLNTGSGTLGGSTFTVYNNVQGVAAADFNKDGIPDFAYTVSFYSPASTLSDVYIEFGNGDGTFTNGPVIQIPGNDTQLVAADFNGNGNIDLAALDTNDAAVIILSGNGDGTFQAPTIFGTASYPTCLLAVPIHDPARPQRADLVTCAATGISIDYNNSR